jgi:DNA-binding transcriptional MerR regulator
MQSLARARLLRLKFDVSAQIFYSPAQVSKILGISTAMLRRYAKAYEAVASDTIYRHPKDGRQFTEAQLDILMKARDYLFENPASNVISALSKALESDLEEIVRPTQSDLDTNNVSSEVLRRVIAEPILEELRQLRLEVNRLQMLMDRDNHKFTRNSSEAQVNFRATFLQRWIRKWLGIE